MRLVSDLDMLQKTPVWNEVKNWNNEDKVNLITLLSVSLAKSPDKKEMEVEHTETEAEKTKRMIAKYADSWCGDESAEDIIRIINEGRHSSMEPLKF